MCIISHRPTTATGVIYLEANLQAFARPYLEGFSGLPTAELWFFCRRLFSRYQFSAGELLTQQSDSLV